MCYTQLNFFEWKATQVIKNVVLKRVTYVKKYIHYLKAILKHREIKDQLFCGQDVHSLYGIHRIVSKDTG